MLSKLSLLKQECQAEELATTFVLNFKLYDTLQKDATELLHNILLSMSTSYINGENGRNKLLQQVARERLYTWKQLNIHSWKEKFVLVSAKRSANYGAPMDMTLSNAHEEAWKMGEAIKRFLG